MKNGKKLSDMPTHTIHYGHIKDGDEVIDEVMVVLMRAPKVTPKRIPWKLTVTVVCMS